MLKSSMDSDDVGGHERVIKEMLRKEGEFMSRGEEVFISRTGRCPRIHRDGANQIARSCPRAIKVVDVAIALEA